MVKTDSETSKNKHKCVSRLDLACQAKSDYTDMCSTNAKDSKALTTINHDSPRRLVPHRQHITAAELQPSIPVTHFNTKLTKLNLSPRGRDCVSPVRGGAKNIIGVQQMMLGQHHPVGWATSPSLVPRKMAMSGDFLPVGCLFIFSNNYGSTEMEAIFL